MRRGRRSTVHLVLGSVLGSVPGAAWLPALLAPASDAVAAPSPDDADAALVRDEDYAAGRAAITAGDFNTALRRLQRALPRFPASADLHNELGYAHRKLRQFAPAFEHYQRALKLDPRHRSAHEYIGEAYLEVGDLPAAERHLAALTAICLLPCEELDDLRRAVAAYKARPRPPG